MDDSLGVLHLLDQLVVVPDDTGAHCFHDGGEEDVTQFPELDRPSVRTRRNPVPTTRRGVPYERLEA